MSTNLFPVQKFAFSNQLIKFAAKPDVLTIEKTARIAASLFLAIPTILFDLYIEFARTVHKFVLLHTARIAAANNDPSAPPAYDLSVASEDQNPEPNDLPPAYPTAPLLDNEQPPAYQEFSPSTPLLDNTQPPAYTES